MVSGPRARAYTNDFRDHPAGYSAEATPLNADNYQPPPDNSGVPHDVPHATGSAPLPDKLLI